MTNDSTTKKTVTVHCNIPKDVVELFERCYPRCRTRFISLALEKAVKDKVLFDKIFFPTVF